MKDNLRDNLLVTAGARAAYMECGRIIDLPSGSISEDVLARFIARIVDRYIDEHIDISFDEYIEEALENEYGVKEK